jgi:hypothetical protein
VAEADRAGRVAADQAGRDGPRQQLVQLVRVAGQHAAQVADADLSAPDGHGRKHLPGRLVQLGQLGPDQLVQAGAA